MGREIELRASDGHRLGAYLAEPAGKPRGGIVVIQEIFGVTAHIRKVADKFASHGFLAVAPAFFDRVAPHLELPYTEVGAGMAIVQKFKDENTMRDAEAGLEHVKTAGKRGVVGFCWGGTVAFLAACRLKIDAAVSYYGGSTTRYLNEHPKCPVMYHFGEKDAHIPLSAIDQIKAADPSGVFHLYPAEHGFNCEERASFEPASAKLAFERSIDFFHRHIG